MCFSKTSEEDLKKTIEESDIIIAACGVPGLIKAQWLKNDCIVIDVGINYVALGDTSVITGDIEFNEMAL